MTREPTLRVAPRRADLNNNGNVFGGWILAQMDIAGGIVAARRARGPVATVAIEGMKFLQPILMGDLISVYAEVSRVGRSSIAIDIEVLAARLKVGDGSTEEEVKVTEGTFTFVAINPQGRPRPVDP